MYKMRLARRAESKSAALGADSRPLPPSPTASEARAGELVGFGVFIRCLHLSLIGRHPTGNELCGTTGNPTRLEIILQVGNRGLGILRILKSSYRLVSLGLTPKKGTAADAEASHQKKYS